MSNFWYQSLLCNLLLLINFAVNNNFGENSLDDKEERILMLEDLPILGESLDEPVLALKDLPLLNGEEEKEQEGSGFPYFPMESSILRNLASSVKVTWKVKV